MRRRTWIIAVAIVVLGAALAGGAYWRWTNSPRYALQRWPWPCKTRNMHKFFKYVNLKDILNNFVEASGQEPENPGRPTADDWTRLPANGAANSPDVFLPKLFDSFEARSKG